MADRQASEPVVLFDIFEAGWRFFAQLQGHCHDGRDVARLLHASYWPPVLQGMADTAGITAVMTKAEAIVRVKQEIARRLAGVQQQA